MENPFALAIKSAVAWFVRSLDLSTFKRRPSRVVEFFGQFKDSIKSREILLRYSGFSRFSEIFDGAGNFLW